jgi:hypothetical protein
MSGSKRVGRSRRQIHEVICRDVMARVVTPAKPLIPHCQEKPLARTKVTVPQTDTGRQGENPKARERTLVQELGKMPP